VSGIGIRDCCNKYLISRRSSVRSSECSDVEGVVLEGGEFICCFCELLVVLLVCDGGLNLLG